MSCFSVARSSRRGWLRLWLGLGLLLAVGPLRGAEFAEAERISGRILELLDQRLALMPEVAAWKWARQQPIYDAERERQVLEKSVAEAKAIDLDGAAAREFFDVQIRMARAMQARCFEEWKAGRSGIPAARDLATEIRPRLDAIGRDLLSAVYLGGAVWRDKTEPETLRLVAPLARHAGVEAALLAELARALRALRITAPASLPRIQKAGVLRIGTTGDYAPFSSDRTGVLAGFDVQLAQALARHWGVEIRFVRTTWPTLMADFENHRFDLALSGISVTPERAARADFSAAYLRDGKTPIARCADAARFGSLAQIDQPGVRLVVNPGGTNERFVREHIRRATIIVFPDNRTIFDEIVAGRADLMITDRIEVQLQTRRHPELCGTMPELLSEQPKAILLPRATGLTAAVNTWLEPQLADGAIATQLQRALDEAR